MASLADALVLSSRLVALSIALQTLELLSLRRAFAREGPFASASDARGLRSLLGREPIWLSLLALQLALAGYLLWHGPSPLLLALSATYLCVIARVGGPFNGGSDGLSVQSLLLLGIAASDAQRGMPSQIALGYLGVQLVLSYFIAGLVKVKQPGWRDGSALRHFARLPKYAAPAWTEALLARPLLARAASWAVLLFECTFPLSLLHPSICLGYLALGAGFHLANAALFGLNRFLFAWLAVYPVLLWLSERVR